MHFITFIILVIGGLNWLLASLFKWDIGDIFGGQEAVVSRIIYFVVGLSAIYEIAVHKKNCRKCSAKMEKGS